VHPPGWSPGPGFFSRLDTLVSLRFISFDTDHFKKPDTPSMTSPHPPKLGPPSILRKLFAPFWPFLVSGSSRRDAFPCIRPSFQEAQSVTLFQVFSPFGCQVQVFSRLFSAVLLFFFKQEGYKLPPFTFFSMETGLAELFPPYKDLSLPSNFSGPFV